MSKFINNWQDSLNPDYVYENTETGHKITCKWGISNGERELFFTLYDKNNNPVTDDYTFDNEEDIINFFNKEITQTNCTNTYFLFGSDAVRVYEDDGIEEVVQQYEDNILTYETFVFKEGVTTPIELLSAYNGYENYTTITEEEFNLL